MVPATRKAESVHLDGRAAVYGYLQLIGRSEKEAIGGGEEVPRCGLQELRQTNGPWTLLST